jgi:hypothetical protein
MSGTTLKAPQRRAENGWVRIRTRLEKTMAPLAVLLLAALATTPGCGGKTKGFAPVPPAPRTFYMGFSAIPPRPDFNVLLQSLQMWTLRADAAIMHTEPPWDSLLAGVPPETLVARDGVPLADYYHGLGLKIVYTVDATNGINRAGESQPLVDAGRSLTEPAIQMLYRRYVAAVDSMLHPDYLGLAAETNLIRAAAPPALYNAVVQVANAAAADVRTFDTATRLYISVQVETAWGMLGPTPGIYVGIQQDVTDFPFMNALGLSSYPYFGWSDPDTLPLDYYSRLRQGNNIPVLVVEGGWSSVQVTGFPSSQATQARYIARQATLLDQAQAVGMFQLTFTDLDTTALPPGTILPLFSYNGLVDENLVPKAALGSWDAVFARPGP